MSEKSVVAPWYKLQAPNGFIDSYFFDNLFYSIKINNTLEIWTVKNSVVCNERVTVVYDFTFKSELNMRTPSIF
jgi:hypothetical protein